MPRSHVAIPRSLVRLLLHLCLILPPDVLAAFCAREGVNDAALEDLAELAAAMDRPGLALRLRQMITPVGEIGPVVEYMGDNHTGWLAPRFPVKPPLSPDESDPVEAPVG